MPDDTRESPITSTKDTAYVYVTGGEAYGTPHESGDRVPNSIPSAKLIEWESAGCIKRVQMQPRKDKKK